MKNKNDPTLEVVLMCAVVVITVGLIVAYIAGLLR
jgi:hypothetical protein